jgi:hypothetical protein
MLREEARADRPKKIDQGRLESLERDDPPKRRESPPKKAKKKLKKSGKKAPKALKGPEKPKRRKFYKKGSTPKAFSGARGEPRGSRQEAKESRQGAQEGFPKAFWGNLSLFFYKTQRRI